MGFRRGIVNWFMKGADVGGWSVLPWQQKRPYIPTQNQALLVKKYLSWVYTCANKNAVNCAQIPLRLYTGRPQGIATKCRFPTRDVPPGQFNYLKSKASTAVHITKAAEVQEVLEHPFLDILYRANDFQNRFDLLESMFLYQELIGNAFWYVVKDGFGTPNEIWALLSQYVRIIPSKPLFVERYEFYINKSDKQDIEVEDMVHFKYINPSNMLLGMGPLQAAITAADLHQEMNIHNTSLIQNGARPDMALIVPGESSPPGDDEVRRMQTDWNSQFRGAKRKGKLAVLTGGQELKPVSLSPQELSYLESKKDAREEICGVFGVPLSMVTTDKVNLANAQAGNHQYMKNTIRPRIIKAEEKMNEKLVPMWDETLFVSFDNPVPEDMKIVIKEREINIKTGFTTINEERSKFGLPPVAWGDEPPQTGIDLGGGGDSVPGTEPDGKTIKQKARGKQKRKLPPLRDETHFDRPKLLEEVVALFKELRAEVLTYYDATFTIDKRYSRQITKTGAEEFVSHAYDAINFDEKLIDTMAPPIELNLVTTGKRAIRQIDENAIFDSSSANVLEALDRRNGIIVDTTQGTTAGGLRSAIQIGILQEESVADIRKRVERFFDYSEEVRAKVIVRTEMVWSFNEGAQEGYKQSGVVEAKEWSASGDDRMCEFCDALDGEIIGLAEAYAAKGDSLFGSDGGELVSSYDDIEHPPAHCQCRCSLIPVLVDV